MARTYNHYCPVARALEVVGEKWSLLIVRDLLRRPQRFSDLLHYASSITPKRLTLTLRKLEADGIVEREKQPGRREVWYRLTPAGHDLGPVVQSLAAWGLRHAMRPPLPGEVVHPDLAMGALTTSLNTRGRKLSQPATLLVHFTPGGPYTLSFDGARWSTRQGEETNANVTVTTTPEAWATFFAVKRDERGRLAQAMRTDGTSELIEEFLYTFGVRDNDGSQATESHADWR